MKLWLIIGIISGMFIPVWDNMFLRAAIKLAILPLIVGIGFEFIMFSGKHDNLFTKIFAAPGLWMQRITTKEPDDKQLAIAICAIKASMPEEFPDFDEHQYDIDVENNLEHVAFTGMKKKDIDKRVAEIKEKQLAPENTENTEIIDTLPEENNEN